LVSGGFSTVSDVSGNLGEKAKGKDLKRFGSKKEIDLNHGFDNIGLNFLLT
jgi:hypothetical protein